MLIVGHEKGIRAVTSQPNPSDSGKEWRLEFSRNEETAGRHLYIRQGERLRIVYDGKLVVVVEMLQEETEREKERYAMWTDNEKPEVKFKPRRASVFEEDDSDQVDLFWGEERIGYVVGTKIELRKKATSSQK